MLNKTNIVFVLLVLSLVNSAVFSSINNVLVFLGLSGLYSLFTILESKKEPVANKSLKEDILNLNERLSKVEARTVASALVKR